MPESMNHQIEALADSPKEAPEKRNSHLDESQRQKQSERLHEQSFEPKDSPAPDLAEQKRKRLEISF